MSVCVCACSLGTPPLKPHLCEGVCVCVCVCARERERERESVCVCVCVPARERERERECVCVCVYERVCVSELVSLCVGSVRLP